MHLKKYNQRSRFDPKLVPDPVDVYEWSPSTITKGNGYTVNAGERVILESGQEIILEPEFVAEAGSEFQAVIGEQYAVFQRVLEGTVTTNGTLLPGVRIVISGTTTYGDSYSTVVYTDSQGRFSVSVPEGSYTINVPHGQIATGQSLLDVGTENVTTDFTVDDYSLVSNITYYHHDMIGNTAVQTDDAGAVVMRAAYYPYGGVVASEGQTEKRLYTGKERDETGLDYFGARYYDSTIGRFTSIDPAGPDPMDPQTYNRYAYCLNNPYKYVDPDGEFAIPLIIAGVWAAAEFAMSAYDAYDTAKTLIDPNISGTEKSIASGLFIAGLIGPGGGYKVGKDKAIDLLSDASKKPYKPIRKHQPGGWGTKMDLDDATAQKVLNEAIPGGKQQYGINNGKVYEFQPDNTGGWHGYPIPGNQAPPSVLKQMLNEGRITNNQYKKLVKGKE